MSNKFCDDYIKNGVIFKDGDDEILNSWYEQYKDMEKEYALPIMMTYKESCKYSDYMSQYDDFPGGKMIPIWEGYNLSAFIGYYYDGPLQGMIFYVNHEEVDISPKFVLLKDFYDYCSVVFQMGLSFDEDEGYEEDEEYFESVCDYYEYKIWNNVIDNNRRQLSKKEVEKNYEIAQNLINIWDKKEYHDNEIGGFIYEQLGFCITKIIPDKYVESLIPYLNLKEDEYVLGRMCDKIAKAKCVKALDSVKVLAEFDGNRILIGGYTNGDITKRTLNVLNSCIED
ncbi:hypothetical protein [Clostridium taeniosporum]|uniref:SMI1/KNR4 family protein n=1 Tax=Clostridium taeniosporum TaxID=394958 RepID=A0A1D7XM02_9CLOT|nr:hypothetical protein [Clostridium taeniosporum]AOR24129.1 hypothetical protein BGI42_10480 [Clostridium taeniosporum]